MVAAAMFAAMAAPASAHYVYDEYYVYESHENCTWNRSEISYGDGGGYRKVTVESSRQLNTWAGDYDCVQDKVVPAGDIANRPILYKWNGAKSRWEACRDPNFFYSPGRGNFYEMNMKPYPADKPPCGDGYTIWP